MSLEKVKVGVASALIVAGITTLLVLEVLARLHRENQSLRQQLANQRLILDENQQVSSRVARLERNSEPLAMPEHDSELLKLRDEVTRLRKENKDQTAALALLRTIPANSVDVTRSSSTENRDKQVLVEINRALVGRQSALDAQTERNGSDPPPNGTVGTVKDKEGNPHLMQFSDGQWQEIDPGDKFIVTQEGALAHRAPGSTNSADGAQTHYSVITNEPAASVPN